MKPDQRTYTVEQALQKLMQFCAYRDRSHKEVEEKLERMRMIPAARELIIIRLMEDGFLSEERFARSFARGKFRIKGWGRRKIKQELALRDFSKPIITLAMSEIQEEDYLEKLRELAGKKSATIAEKNPLKRKKKLQDYLLRKGYEPELVYQLTEGL